MCFYGFSRYVEILYSISGTHTCNTESYSKDVLASPVQPMVGLKSRSIKTIQHNR
jgi:hypothetical protein